MNSRSFIKGLIKLMSSPLLGNSMDSNRADSRFASSKRETVLLCNNVSHWLDTNLESALSKTLVCWNQYVYGIDCRDFYYTFYKKYIYMIYT